MNQRELIKEIIANLKKSGGTHLLRVRTTIAALVSERFDTMLVGDLRRMLETELGEEFPSCGSSEFYKEEEE